MKGMVEKLMVETENGCRVGNAEERRKQRRRMGEGREVKGRNNSGLKSEHALPLSEVKCDYKILN